jgi:putative transposase
VARYRFVAEHRTRWSVEEMCRLLAVSRSGFYGWQRRGPSARSVENEQLAAAIQRLFAAHHRRPGSPKMTELLRAEGWQVSPSRVARRMRALGLRSICRRARRVTTDSSHSLTVAPNLLARQFTPTGPDQNWVSDIERHEALLHRAVMKGHATRPSQRPGEAEGSRTPGDAGDGGKQP